jgi:hypothetical protein
VILISGFDARFVEFAEFARERRNDLKKAEAEERERGWKKEEAVSTTFSITKWR